MATANSSFITIMNTTCCRVWRIGTISRKDFVLFNPKFHAHRTINTKHYFMYLEFDYTMTQTAPEMTSLLEIANTSAPLNVYTGNSRLKKSTNHRVSLGVPFRFSHTQNQFSFRPSYNITKNAIAYGYTYSTATGIRHYRPENIDGNYQIAMDINYSSPMLKQKLTLSSVTHGHLYHGVDLIAEDGAASTTSSSVNTWWGTETLTLNYALGKHSIGAKGYVGVGHVSANRLNFSSYNLCDFNYGLTALIKLPWAMQLSTDLTMYSHRGYATGSMNTDDVVWNARLTKSFNKAGIVLMLDGFDILGNLSNTTQVMNTQGRTETYRNALPCYVMFHFQYRLNVKPKKK